jgi:hypothetical protein
MLSKNIKIKRYICVTVIEWGYLRTGCQGECLDFEGKGGKEVGETCMLRNFMICTACMILLG